MVLSAQGGCDKKSRLTPFFHDGRGVMAEETSDISEVDFLHCLNFTVLMSV